MKNLELIKRRRLVELISDFIHAACLHAEVFFGWKARSCSFGTPFKEFSWRRNKPDQGWRVGGWRITESWNFPLSSHLRFREGKKVRRKITFLRRKMFPPRLHPSWDESNEISRDFPTAVFVVSQPPTQPGFRSNLASSLSIARKSRLQAGFRPQRLRFLIVPWELFRWAILCRAANGFNQRLRARKE